MSENNDFNNQYRNQTPPPDQINHPNSDKSNYAMVSMIMGIISLVTCGGSLLTQILGIVFAIAAKNPITGKIEGSAKVGLVCSIISFIPMIAFFILTIALIVGGGCAALGV